jgi:adenosine 3'-phospho 5'-phosphosulfate transporter B3
MRKAGIFVTLVQFGLYSVFGTVERQFQSCSTRKIPIKSYLILALLTVGTMGLSNTSLGYLNYPTQVIFKSSKLIPVMVGGILIQGKKYSFLDFCACMLMTLGLVAFTTADMKVSPNFDPIGVVLISLALCADAAIGNFQELSLKKYKATNAELVLYSYGIGFIFLLIGYFISGGGFDKFNFLLNNYSVLLAVFLFSLTGYIGILFVLHLVRSVGALVAVTVTTCRKALTMVLSFILFSKPFTIWYIFAGFLVMCGIALNMYSKNLKKRVAERKPSKFLSTQV